LACVDLTMYPWTKINSSISFFAKFFHFFTSFSPKSSHHLRNSQAYPKFPAVSRCIFKVLTNGLLHCE
jgi:hypothetical protein